MRLGPKFSSMTCLGVSALLVLVGALALAACGSGATTQTDETSAGGAAAVEGAGSPEAGPARGLPVTALDMDPRDPSILYAATSDGLFKTSDAAGSWQRLSRTLRCLYRTVAVDPASPSTIYAIYCKDSAVRGRLQRSDDGGATWVELSDAGSPRISGYESFAWFDVTATPSTVFMWGLRGADHRVYRSADRGETWTRDRTAERQNAPWSPGAVPRRMSAAARQALDAFMAPFESSPSNGNACIVVKAGASLGLNVLGGRPVVDPRDPSIFYAATMQGVYKSLDGAKTWKLASTGLGATKGEVP
jgi:hypothetical protein